MTIPTRRTIAALAWLAVAPASGQTAGLDVVDERVADVSPLAVSLRTSRPSLRQPADFGRVYRFQDESNRLARAQGALYAVFERSVYAADKDGNVFPVVPPGTVYYIGRPSGFAASTPLPAAADRHGAVAGRIDGRIESWIGPAGTVGMEVRSAAFPRQPRTEPPRHRSTTGDAPWTVRPATGIVLDPEYRARRLKSLMQDAATARRSFRQREDRRRHQSIPGTPATGPGTPSGD